MSGHYWREDDIYVACVGAQTPVGRSALKAAAAVRCGMSAYQEHPFMTDQFGEPMVVALADWLPLELSAADRAIRLGVEALKEVMQPAQSVRPEKLPLFVALSNTTFPLATDQQQVVLGLQENLSRNGLAVEPQIFAEGNAVGVLAIKRAVERLQNGSEQAIVVLGVDSHLGPTQLEKIDRSGRLHSINNSWGFTPGEGAGAILLVKGRTLKQKNLAPLAHLNAVAVSEEKQLLGTKTVCIGEGLTQAFRDALSTNDKVYHSYCDLNGETYRADEFGFAICRTGEGFHDAGSFCAAADCWGDVGSASAPLQIALATAAWSRGYAKGTCVLCWSSSTASPLRGAMRLSNTWQQMRGA